MYYDRNQYYLQLGTRTRSAIVDTTKMFPTSEKAGHIRTLSPSSPPWTVRYPVLPAKYSFLCEWGSSTTQSAGHRSNAVRPVKTHRISALLCSPRGHQDLKGDRRARGAHPTSPAHGIDGWDYWMHRKGRLHYSLKQTYAQRMRDRQEVYGVLVHRCGRDDYVEIWNFSLVHRDKHNIPKAR